jgi:hypothetical protein
MRTEVVSSNVVKRFELVRAASHPFVGRDLSRGPSPRERTGSVPRASPSLELLRSDLSACSRSSRRKGGVLRDRA